MPIQGVADALDIDPIVLSRPFHTLPAKTVYADLLSRARSPFVLRFAKEPPY